MKANNDQDLNLINYNISKPLHDQTSLIDSEEGQDVNKLIKQFSQMGKMMKMMKSGGLDNMMKNLGGSNPNFK